MPLISYKKTRPPVECKFSEIKLNSTEGSNCCDPLFIYDQLVLDFGNNTAGIAHRNEILESEAEAFHIATSFQHIWLLGVTSIQLQAEGKLGIKFEKCIVL